MNNNRNILKHWKLTGTWGTDEAQFTKEELRIQRQIAELSNEYDVECSKVIFIYIVVKDGRSIYI